MLERVSTGDGRLMVAVARRTVPPWMDLGLRTLTHAGDATITVGVSLLLVSWPDTRYLGILTAVANLSSHLAVQFLKRTVIRQRPSARLPGLTALVDLPDQFSFPSGHSAAAMALAASTFLQNPLIGLVALTVALGVGASRVYLRVHYVTDVVVGQALGAAAAVVVHLTLR